ncbi:hypothetical protein LY85_2243 [Clostridium sp. KNHs216]|nr:hypothetical protein LY85_2243 [Clostridium sp. KNHs216]
MVDNKYLNIIFMIIWVIVLVLTNIIGSYFEKKNNHKMAFITKIIYWIISAVYILSLIIIYNRK